MARQQPSLSTPPAWLLRQVKGDLDLEQQAAEAYDPFTAPERLSELALAPSDVLSGIKEGACRNPSLPPAALTKVAKQGSASLRKAVAANPALFAALQRRLLLDPANQVLIALATNPVTLPAVIHALAAHRFPRVRAAVAARETEVSAPDRAILARDPEPSVRLALAANQQASPRLLALLAQDPDQFVRWKVACHSHTAPATLLHLAAAPEGVVQKGVAANPRTPLPGFLRLIQAERCWESLIGNPALPAELVIRLSRTENRLTKHKILDHPNLPELQQLQLAAELRWQGVRGWRGKKSASPRVNAWFKRPLHEDAERLALGSIAQSRWGQVKVQIHFPTPAAVDLRALDIKGYPGENYGWWAPELGDRWLAFIDLGHNTFVGGLVPSGPHQMKSAQFWVHRDPNDVPDAIFQHSDWRTRDTGDGPLAENYANPVIQPPVFPALPNLKPQYTQAEESATPVNLRGVLLYQQNLYALWLNARNQEVGWEALTNFSETTVSHRVRLLDPANSPLNYPASWGKFETMLRRVAYGRSL